MADTRARVLAFIRPPGVLAPVIASGGPDRDQKEYARETEEKCDAAEI
jgi:hypothetical protein